MEEANAVAKNVARATVAALDWRSSSDDRKAAASYIESIKTGDVRILATASFLLVKKDWSSGIRLQAFKLLQHLVRLRWEELSTSEGRNFAKAAMDLMSESADSSDEWALKSQTAVLVAEIVRREGLAAWQELFHSLVTLANKGPIQAELVLMMLRWLPEDITVHNEDLEGDRRRLLLRGLTQSLSEVLPLLYSLLERHFGAALTEAGRQQFETSKQHAAAVTAALHAITAYAEWAPLLDLVKYGIIHGCGILLSSPDFRLLACDFFKLVCPRKRPPEASASEFDAAMTSVFQILMNVSGEFLSISAPNPGVIEEREYEFAEFVCESMVSLGSSNLQCISGESTVLSLYFQQMLGYFQHYKIGLHYQSLLFWLGLMRDLTSKPKVHVHSAGESSAAATSSLCASEVDTEKKRLLTFVRDDICSAILDASFPRLVKKKKFLEKVVSLGTVELWSNDFEGKGEFGQYRSRLLELIRFIAVHKPLLAGAKVAERIISVIKNALISSSPAQDLAVMESMSSALDNVVSAVFEGLEAHGSGSSEVQRGLCITFEGLLQQFLGLKWTEPSLVEVLGHYLDALGPFLKYYPNAVGSVINKLFELLTSLPSTVKDPAMSSARHARLNICTSFIRIAKTADKSVVPHMKAIADTMAHLQREGRLLRAEHNILGEAFLIMASATGIQQQQEVLVWFLEPLSQQWIQPDWQNNYLSDPSGLVRLCMDPSFMWSIFHSVTFFEKALKRSGYNKNNLGNSDALHPMASHLYWMLPPLLKLLRVLHSLWSPPVLQNLPKEIKAAMTMSDVERTGLVGEGQSKSSKAALTFVDGAQIDQEGQVEPNENDIRNWMKGIRDSGYNVLGLSTTLGEPFYKCLDSQSIAVALLENIQSMDFRHIRQLVHSVLIPMVKFCPSNMWEFWLEKLLHPLFSHSQQALCSSWSSLLHEGRAKIPDTVGMTLGSELKVEVMEEKLLRDLTREICSLLSVIASPTLNSGLPSLEQSGHANRVDLSSLKDLDAFSQTSMLSFLMKNKDLVLPVLRLSLEVLTWTDSEAVGKVSSFCSTLVLLAVFTNNVELCNLVSRDLFSSIIHGLTLESNTFVSGDLVGLCREIFVYLCDRNPAPRQVLLSLPSITPQDLTAFEEAMSKTLSPKEQKQHMKSLLVLATGNKLKALSAQKGAVNVITNMSSRPRSSSMNAPLESRVEEGESLGLAAIL